MERLADGARIVDAAGAEPPEVRVVRAHGGPSTILPPLPARFQALGYGLLLTGAVGEAGRDVTRALGVAKLDLHSPEDGRVESIERAAPVVDESLGNPVALFDLVGDPGPKLGGVRASAPPVMVGRREQKLATDRKRWRS
jgi:hypothetical protein